MNARAYLDEVASIANGLDDGRIEALVTELVKLRKAGGRLFVLGLGGSAANASHAAADLRNLCEIDAYCLTDNVAAFTAASNDVGFKDAFRILLRNMHFTGKDALLVLSVGGGTEKVSVAISDALIYAKGFGAKTLGIVGPDGGMTESLGDVVVKVPCIAERRVTPHTEAFQAVIWHLLVSHPKLQMHKTKW